MPFATQQVLRGIAIGLGGLAALAAAIELSRSVRPDHAEHGMSEDRTRATLEQCRTLTPEDYATAEECRAAWDQSRRRFFSLPSVPAEME